MTAQDTVIPLGTFGVVIPPSPPSPPKPLPSGHGRTRVGPLSGSGDVGGGGAPSLAASVHRVTYDVCTENISRILVGHDSSQPPKIQLLTSKTGLVEATLSDDQPYSEMNAHTLTDRFLFEAPLAPGETIFTIYAVDYESNVGQTLIEIEGCEGTIIFVDDKVILPQIFDVKFQIDNGTQNKAAFLEHKGHLGGIREDWWRICHSTHQGRCRSV